MRITAKRKTGGEVSADYDFGDNLEASVALFGAEMIHKHFVASMKVAFQGWLRAQLDAKKTQEEIDAAAKDWKPGERTPSKSPQEKLRDLLNGMSAEDRANILKEFKAKAA